MDSSTGAARKAEAAPSMPEGGFKFDLCHRNAMLESMGMKAPTMTKTGTTICGVLFRGGVVLGADTRSTAGSTISDKNCEKIHYIAPNIRCCGAGTAADTEQVTAMVSSQLELLRLATGTASRVVTAVTRFKRYLFRYQGHVSAALVLGGVDSSGPHLYTIYPHGSTDKLPFVAMGSGSLAAMAVLESGFSDDLSEEQAVRLIKEAIAAGIFNDLASGGNIDLCIIREDGRTEMVRTAERLNEGSVIRARYHRPAGVAPRPGTTPVLATKVEELRRRVEVMDISA